VADKEALRQPNFWLGQLSRKGSRFKPFPFLAQKGVGHRSRPLLESRMNRLRSGVRFTVLVVDVVEGLKKDGIVVMNTTKKPEEVDLKGYRVAVVDATGIALELGLSVAGIPVINTPMLGAFSRATQEVKLESVIEAIKEEWQGSKGEKNAKGAALAYDGLTKGW